MCSITTRCGSRAKAVQAIQRDEAVDRVAALRLVQRELVAAPVELVAAVFKPIRPRDQGLTPARGAHLVYSVAIDNVPTAGRV
jgi:hypothetical protein